MSMTFITSAFRDACNDAVYRLLTRNIQDAAQTVILVPHAELVVELKEYLCDKHAFCLGCTVDTWQNHIKELWSYAGDGRRFIDGRKRLMLAAYVCGIYQQNTAAFGYTDLLERLSSRALFQICKRAPDMLSSLSKGEKELLDDIRSYSKELKSRNLVELSEVAEVLGELLYQANIAPKHYIFVGFYEVEPSLCAFIASLARRWDVSVVLEVPEGPASAYMQDVCRRISSYYAGKAVFKPAQFCIHNSHAASGELARIRSNIFISSADKISSEGAVSFVFSAGPSARWRALAQKICELKDAGISSIALASTDPARDFRELARRLLSHGITCRASYAMRGKDTVFGRAWINYLSSLALLYELAKTEPQSDLSNKTPRVYLCDDMSWWPPLSLLDFMRSEISHVKTEKVQALDARWRSDRLLTPSRVLDCCMKAKTTSQEMAQSCSDILQGKIASAAKRLLMPFLRQKKDLFCAQQAISVLSEAIECAETMENLHLFDSDVGLSQTINMYLEVFKKRKMTFSPETNCLNAVSSLDIFDYRQILTAQQRSYDALILCDQSSDLMSYAASDDAGSYLLERFGIEDPICPHEKARLDFVHLLEIPKTHLLVERTMFSADGQKRYPSVMLTELLLCYGLSQDAKPNDIKDIFVSGCVSVLGEDEITQNLSSQALRAVCKTTETLKAKGVISASMRNIVVPPSELTRGADSHMYLSASQIETYLECPYKWFSLRRLKLDSKDSEFSGAEQGTFAHRVLELTYRELAAQKMDTKHNLSEAQMLLEHFFDEHLQHQYILQKGHHPMSQALVPHSASDFGQIYELKKNLSGFLAFESGLCFGFSPMAFEWRFGKDTPVEYAGVQVTGTVDRIDCDQYKNAVIIDYKYKNADGFIRDYNALEQGKDYSLEFLCPRHIQSLMYAQIVQRQLPQLNVQASLYFCAKSNYAVAGAVHESFSEQILGEHIPGGGAKTTPIVKQNRSFGAKGSGMQALLDATEEMIASKITLMLEGHIEAVPFYEDSCRYCPVLGCEKRLCS